AGAELRHCAFESSERYGYPAGFLARYFEKLRYRFGPRERAGLYTFLEMAHEVGELAEVPELRFISAAGAPVSESSPRGRRRQVVGQRRRDPGTRALALPNRPLERIHDHPDLAGSRV